MTVRHFFLLRSYQGHVFQREREREGLSRKEATSKRKPVQTSINKKVNCLLNIKMEHPVDTVECDLEVRGIVSGQKEDDGVKRLLSMDDEEDQKIRQQEIEIAKAAQVLICGINGIVTFIMYMLSYTCIVLYLLEF